MIERPRSKILVRVVPNHSFGDEPTQEQNISTSSTAHRCTTAELSQLVNENSNFKQE
jgi:hypothetical protein